MATNTNNLQSALPVPSPLTATSYSQYWPILCQGDAKRLVFPGPPQLEKEWHKTMVEGQKLESSITGALYSIQQQKQQLQAKVQSYLDLNQVATDAQFKRRLRRFKLAADILNFIQKIHTAMTDIQGLTQALQTNLQILQTIEASAQSMIQNNLNALANFMQQICNLGLPPLPAIPTFFGTNVFGFNGFCFATLIPRNISFSQFSNFSFAQCSLVGPNTGIYDQPPVVINFGGYTVGSQSGNFVPPLNGVIAAPNVDPTILQGTTDVPVYVTNVNPQTLLVGSLPNPADIVSAYQLPTTTYQANIASVVPALQPIVIEPGDPDYNPTGTATPSTARQSEFRKLLIQNISLANIVANNYDKNLMACWLFYLQACRNGRAGEWLPNFETAYINYVVPSLSLLQNPTTTMPWNNVMGGTGIQDEPTDIPLLDLLQKVSTTEQQNILWKLSYVEASLLGYTRTVEFDAAADNMYLETFTGDSLDYVALAFSTTDTQTITLGQGTAQFPVQCTFPKSMANVLNQVIQVATANIAGDTAYQTTKLQFRFTFNAYAQATVVDRFTQFWRTFNYNLQQLLAQDPYLVGFVINYTGSLNSAINPLATSDDYVQVQNDALTRNRTWIPGTPLLPIPQAPVVEIGVLPGLVTPTTGWAGSNFDPGAFLERPDVQSLPLSTQLTMLRTNESYANLMTTSAQLAATTAQYTAQAQAALATTVNTGFSVTSTANLKVANAAPPIPVSFTQVNFDVTGYITSPIMYTIQVTGLYIISGQVDWDKGPAGVRSIFLMRNSNIVLDEEQTASSTPGPTTQNFGVIHQLNAGDTIQVLAGQTSGADTELTSGSQFSCLLVPASEAVSQPPYNDADTLGSNPNQTTRSLPADTDIPLPAAVAIQPDGGVLPVDPVGAIATPFVDGITTDPVTTGALADVGTNYGSMYMLTGTNFTPGGLVYAGPGGVLTQDYNTLITEVNWVIVVGRAVAGDILLFQPQIPTQVV